MKISLLTVIVLLGIYMPLISQTTFGINWEELNTGTQKHIRDLYFVDANLGYAVGDDSLILKTTDRGNTWTLLNFPDSANPLGNGGNMSAIAFTSANNGMLTYTFTQEVLGTTNGGIGWDEIPGLPGALCTPARMIFDGPNEGYMVGTGCFGGAFISTYDPGGWNNAIMVHYGPTQGGLHSVTKDTGNDVVMAVGAEGTIIRTTDLSFADFDTIVIADTTDLTSIDYAGNNTYYISTSNEFEDIYISTNGGNSFHVDSTYPFTFYYPELNELDFVFDKWGVAVGKSGGGEGIIAHKKGNTWEITSSDFPLNAIHVVDSTLAFAAGDSGKIYRYQLFPDMGINNEVNNNGILVFPNPVFAGAMVQLTPTTSAEITKIELCDLQGRVLREFKVIQTGNSINIVLPAVSSGMYLLRSYNEKQVFTSKILIK